MDTPNIVVETKPLTLDFFNGLTPERPNFPKAENSREAVRKYWENTIFEEINRSAENGFYRADILIPKEFGCRYYNSLKTDYPMIYQIFEGIKGNGYNISDYTGDSLTVRISW